MDGGFYFMLLVQPMYNLLVFLYNIIPGQDLGLAIIGLTVIIRLILWPATRASFRSQHVMQAMQPKLDAIKEQYKDKTEQSKAMMELYKEEKVNPLGSCLPMVVQLVILIALYTVLRRSFDGSLADALYGFIARPETLNAQFLGFMDLAVRSIPIAILAAGVQFWSAKLMMTNRPPKELRNKEGAKDEDLAASMSKSMLYTMPIVTMIIGITLPAGLTLYWLVSSLMQVIQQLFIKRELNKKQLTATISS